MDENESKPPLDGFQKMALSMWIVFCIFGFTWFISKVIAGRHRMRMNFDNIEQQLLKLQKSIEEQEAKDKNKALTYKEAEAEEIQQEVNEPDKKTD